MAKRPTIRDLAEESGVSVATVDRVLNGRQSVREGTALRVLEAARRIGYHATPLLKQRIAGRAPVLALGLLVLDSDEEFYAHMLEVAADLAGMSQAPRVKLVTGILPSIAPDDIIAALRDMAARVQAIGLVSIDHPRITEEVARLRGEGIPVFAILSDFAQGVRAGYIGTNNLKVGRTAASMLARALPETDPPREVAIFVGGHRWHGHELRETGFRTWFRLNRPDIRLLDTQVNLDTAKLTYEATLSLLSRHPRLAGIYCAGGGREGLIRALRDERPGTRIEVVANEFTEATRRALADGYVSMVIHSPVEELLQNFFRMADEALKSGPAESGVQKFLPMQLYLPESF
ncbi:LacI family DNA-binding transcriptional regulator [Mangrovicoccus sp. HB161399]|uniref:LacI family DNA-binding transcriptional regulator n=1 Tax=Mangrovicoccus sp. HB161399 TaxID=2720392 RepID=UPI0015577A5B|nr:LacI family DNA-binding transcriptional regulator [Mangrovicoccus sp. HB161399]